MEWSRMFGFSRVAPLVMSTAALAICFIGKSGILRDPPGDEGALAHSYQLLMAAQLPVMLAFVVFALRQHLRRDLFIFGLQAALWITALAMVGALGL